MNLPIALVETWLLLANDTDPDYEEASEKALYNILKYFGNLDVAEEYLRIPHKSKKP